MNILLVHNHYQGLGGEDVVVNGESSLLEKAGHGVGIYRRRNDELTKDGALGNAIVGIGAVWKFESQAQIKEVLLKELPDVVHFHNTFPLISPAAYYACAELKVPVVQTLHNYRTMCPGANLLREGKVCELCVGKSVPWPGMVHRCYRGSFAATGAAAAMIATHRLLGTWRTKVDRYIALTEFAKAKFVEGGLPEERISVKPNFVSGDDRREKGEGRRALYVGRLSEEKGPQVMCEAWHRHDLEIPLRVIGDGPLRRELVHRAGERGKSSIEFSGRCEQEEVRQEMGEARFLVLPSVCYENFPTTIAEAFAESLPVIASRLGAMAEIVQDGVTGLHFEAGNAADLAAKVQWAWEHPEEMQRMGRAARAEYEAKYTPERNYQMLMEIYERAIASRD